MPQSQDTDQLPVAHELASRAHKSVLNSKQRERFSRHILLGEVGVNGQLRLASARVLVVGAGGLGSPASLYLAAAGIGTIGLVDFDLIEVSNLQRQILFTERDVGLRKVDVAAQRLREIHSQLEVEVHALRLDSSNAEALVAAYDLVIDGTDNFATRYLLSDCCVIHHKPYIYGSVLRFSGQASVFYPPHGPCYRCLFPAAPAPGQVPSCAEGGVLGVLPGQIAMIQATEAIKVLLGIGVPLLGRLLNMEALSMQFSSYKLTRDEACPSCGAQSTIKTAQDSVQYSAQILAGQRPAQEKTAMSVLPDAEIDVHAYHTLREAGTAHLLVDVRAPAEAEVCKIEGSTLLPLPELAARLGELPQDLPLIVHCKGGSRSAQAVSLLQQHGYKNARSLTGGILAWAEHYDPSLARY